MCTSPGYLSIDRKVKKIPQTNYGEIKSAVKQNKNSLKGHSPSWLGEISHMCPMEHQASFGYLGSLGNLYHLEPRYHLPYGMDRPSITVGILVSLLHCRLLKLNLSINSNRWKTCFGCRSDNIKSSPYHFMKGWKYYPANACQIAVMHSYISYLQLYVLFFVFQKLSLTKFVRPNNKSSP